MKTPIRSKIGLLALLLTAFLSGQALAQTQPKVDDGNIRLTIRKSTKGEVTYLEDQRYLRSEQEANEILAEYGVDNRVEQLAPGEEVEIVLRRRKPATQPAGNEDAAEARPMLGVLYSVEPITLGRVDRVFSGTGADKAGMKVGDIIIAIDGENIHSGDQIRDIIAAHKPGQTVRLTFLRNGQKRETLATLGEWRDIPMEQRIPSLSPDWQYRYPNNGNFNASLQAPGYLGVTSKQYDSPEATGAIVLEVIKGTPAEQAGLRPGVVILAVNGQPVTPEQTLANLIFGIPAGAQVHLLLKWQADAREQDVVTLTLASRNDFITPVPHHTYAVPRTGLESATTPWLGVQAGNEGIGLRGGALVAMVYDESPAEALGLRTGDLITAIGDEQVEHWSALVEIMKRHQAGEVVRVTWMRKGQQMEGTAALSPKKADYSAVEEWEELRITIRKDAAQPAPAEESQASEQLVDGAGNLAVESWEVFPNPSDGEFEITLQMATKGEARFQVFDQAGRKVWEQVSLSVEGRHSLKLDLRQQPAGTYFLVATQGGKSKVKQLVVL